MGKLFNPRTKFVGKSVENLDRTFAGPRDPDLSDTTGPAFCADFLTPQVLNGLEAKGYDQDDINSFYNWIDNVDRDAAHQQGFTDEDLFYRYMESLKPQTLAFGESPLKSLGMAPSPDSVYPMPKGGL